MKYGSTFIFICTWISNGTRTICWKKLYFPHWITLTPFWKTSWLHYLLLFLKSVFFSTDLYVYSCTNTTLFLLTIIHNIISLEMRYVNASILLFFYKVVLVFYFLSFAYKFKQELLNFWKNKPMNFDRDYFEPIVQLGNFHFHSSESWD